MVSWCLRHGPWWSQTLLDVTCHGDNPRTGCVRNQEKLWSNCLLQWWSDVGQLLVLSQQQLVGVNCPLFIGLFIGVEEIITIVRLVSAGLDLCKLIYIQLNHWVGMQIVYDAGFGRHVATAWDVNEECYSRKETFYNKAVVGQPPNSNIESILTQSSGANW